MSVFARRGYRATPAIPRGPSRTCQVCGRIIFGGTGGHLSHGMAHVRRGEAVELAKERGADQSPARMILPTGDSLITRLLDCGFEVRENGRPAASRQPYRNATSPPAPG